MEVETGEQNGYYFAKITALLGNCKLYEEKHSRSFQHVSMTYADVVKEVIKDTPGVAAVAIGVAAGGIAVSATIAIEDRQDGEVRDFGTAMLQTAGGMEIGAVTGGFVAAATPAAGLSVMNGIGMHTASSFGEEHKSAQEKEVREGIELNVFSGPVGPQIDLTKDVYLPGDLFITQYNLFGNLEHGVNRASVIVKIDEFWVE